MAENLKTIAIITRVHPQRPNMRRKCIESVKNQTSDDWVHILLQDDRSARGYGKHAANRSFAKLKEIPAKYVMVLDDDDMLMEDNFVADFKGVIQHAPEIVFFKGIVHKLGILPRPGYWKKPPKYGQIASFCFAVRRDIWFKNIKEFGKRELGGDFCFISACFKNTTSHAWWGRVIAKTQKGPGRSKGEKEHA